MGPFAAGLVNHGVIGADVSNQTLSVSMSSAGLANSGTLRASGGGQLNVQGGTLDNQLGTIEALDGSRVSVGSSIVNGGTFHTAGSGVISLAGSTIIGGTQNVLGKLNLGGAAISGDVTMSGGTVTESAHGASTADRLINEGAVLSGISLNNLTVVNHGSITSGSISGSLINSGHTISVPSGKSLSIQGTLDNSAGVIEAQSGGAVTLTNVSSLSGTLRTLAGGTLNLGGTLNSLDSYAFDNQGSVNFSTLHLGGIDLHLSGGSYRGSVVGDSPTSRVTNEAGVFAGSLTSVAVTNQSIIENSVVKPSATGVVNTGTMRSTGSATLELGAGTYNNAGGIIDQQGGKVQLDVGASISGGTLHTAPGTTMVVGVLTAGGAAVLSNTALQNEGSVQASFMQIGSGEVQLTGGGSVGVINIVGTDSTSKLVNVDNLIHSDPAVITAAAFTLGNTTPLAIENHGIIDSDRTGKSISMRTSGFTNTGTVRASNGGVLTVTGGVVNTGGTIEARAGVSLTQPSRITVQGDIHGGSLHAGSLSSITLASSHVTALEGLTIDAQGSVSLSSMATLTLNSGTYSYQGTLAVNLNGRLDVAGGVTLTGGGTLSLADAQLRVLVSGSTPDARLTNLNSTIQGFGNLGGGTVEIDNQSQIKATTALSVNRTLEIQPNQLGLHNHGSITATNATVLILHGDTLDTANGTIEAQANSTLQIHGALVNSGTLNVLANATGTSDSQISQTAGATRVDGILTAPEFDLHGGSLSGIGQLQGNVFHDGGVVSPGSSPGIMHIAGNYTQSSGGHLSLEIAGLILGSEYDQLDVTGGVVLGGTIDITFRNGFVPQVGDHFDVLHFGGTFTPGGGSILVLNGPATLQFSELAHDGLYTLTVTSVPEPSAFTLGGIGLAVVMLGAVRRRSATRNKPRV